MEQGPVLIEVRELAKHFAVRQRGRGAGRVVRAVDGVSFAVHVGETLAIVGESGCGKTTTARMLLRLLTPTSGAVRFRGRDIFALRDGALKEYRAGVQIVFQDPHGSLSPRMLVREIVEEPLLALTPLRPKERRDRVAELLLSVGLEPASMAHYPHEFSGGQQQRIAIARALASSPSLIVLDEPVSSLDVSIRAQIMNLLKDLQDRLRLSYILIAHDLATVRYLAHRVAVMYLGKVVEVGDGEPLFEQPLHPYTRALLDAAGLARLDEPETDSVAATFAVPTGCAFHPRCPVAAPRCSLNAPALRPVMPGREVACHFADAMTSSPHVGSEISVTAVGVRKATGLSHAWESSDGGGDP